MNANGPLQTYIKREELAQSEQLESSGGDYMLYTLIRDRDVVTCYQGTAKLGDLMGNIDKCGYRSLQGGGTSRRSLLLA